MPQELAKRNCPQCRREVDAVRSAPSGEWFWYLFYGAWNLLFDWPEPWRCRECGTRIPPTGREVFWRRVRLAVVILLVLAGLASLVMRD